MLTDRCNGTLNCDAIRVGQWAGVWSTATASIGFLSFVQDKISHFFTRRSRVFCFLFKAHMRLFDGDLLSFSISLLVHTAQLPRPPAEGIWTGKEPERTRIQQGKRDRWSETATEKRKTGRNWSRTKRRFYKGKEKPRGVAGESRGNRQSLIPPPDRKTVTEHIRFHTWVCVILPNTSTCWIVYRLQFTSSAVSGIDFSYNILFNG